MRAFGRLTRWRLPRDSTAPTSNEIEAARRDPNCVPSASLAHCHHNARKLPTKPPSKARRAHIPLQGDMALLHPLHVESHSWNGAVPPYQHHMRLHRHIDLGTTPALSHRITYSIVNSPPCATASAISSALETRAVQERSPPGLAAMMFCRRSGARSW
ncbi:unnamed protein product [Cercospora beticola]|nr:unnamed protein product [Cercospora beticola]